MEPHGFQFQHDSLFTSRVTQTGAIVVSIIHKGAHVILRDVFGQKFA
jgi:hypothetical protein